MPSEKAFTDLFQNHPIPMWVYDAQTLGFLEVNEAACKAYGYERETFLTLGLRDIRPPEDVPLLEAHRAQARAPFQEGGIWRHRTRDQRLLHVEIVSRTMRFGARDAVLVMARDVSARWQEEQELKSTLIRLAQARELAHLGLWDLDLLSGRLQWSWEGLGIPLPPNQKRLEDLDGLLALVPAEDRARVRERMDLACREEATFELEPRLVLDSGEERILRLVAEASKDDHGRPVHLWGIAQDVTERERSEEETRLSEQRLRTLVEQAPVAITVVRHGRILYLNSKAVELFGLPDMEEPVGRPLRDYVGPQPGAGDLDEALQQTDNPNANRAFEATGYRPDGTPFPLDLAVAFLRLPNGPAQAAFLTDLTERRRAEAQQRDFQNKMMAAQRMESLGCLASGVAHDMNNVLAAILSIANVHQLTAPEGTELRANMDTIARACLRGRALVQGLLGFARKKLAEERRLDLNDLVREQAELLEHTMLQRIRLETDLEPCLRPVLGDPAALSHALMNLCVNAMDAMPGGGRLAIRTANAGEDEVLLEVRDSGCGIPQEVLDRVLEPFFTTKPQGKGTGMGLPIVYGTVQAHKGDMSLASTPGQGTTVSIRLPACPAGPALEPDRPAPAGATRPLAILVVDDDELIRLGTAQLLGVLGHAATLVDGAEEALARLEAEEAFDVVLLDLNMPNLGGAAALPLLRALRPDLPVIIVTGRADQQALDLAAAVPGVKLLPKPFSREDLQLLLRTL